jgi:hypothetical protein
MTFCHFDEFEDAVLSIELAAEKFSGVQTSPTLWKWVILAMQNALQGAMVLALTGTDGCGALFPDSQKRNREWSVARKCLFASSVDRSKSFTTAVLL